MKRKICHVKIDVSCEASVDFHDMSQNATPATEFAPCHHFAQRWQCDSQKTRNTTRPKCCACHTKWPRRYPKCCACHEKRNTSSENVAKVSRLPHKTSLDTSWNMLKCHEVPRLPRKTTWPQLRTRQEVTLLRLSHRHGNFAPTTAAGGRLQTVANGWGRQKQGHANTDQPPDPQM